MKNTVDKELVARRFERHRETYRTHAAVQQEMAEKLTAALPRVAYGRALEFGCGAGLLTDCLARHCQFGKLFLNDLVVEEVDNFIPGDIEEIELPGDLDLIAANAVWQWLENPRALIRRMYDNLNAHGIVAISSFAPDNLPEIARILEISLPYPEIAEFHDSFAAYFDIVRFEEYSRVLWFETPKKVLEHLKLTGVTGLNSDHRWTRGRLEGFSAEYSRRFSNGEAVRLTYRPILLVGRRKEPGL